MNDKAQFTKKTVAYILRVIFAGVLSLFVGVAGTGRTLQAAAEGLTQTDTGSPLMGDVRTAPNASSSGAYSSTDTSVLMTPIEDVDNFDGKSIGLTELDGKLQFHDTVNTTAATRETLDPDIGITSECNSSQGEYSVWYHYVATADISLYVDTIGSSAGYDTVVAVWTGSPGNFTLVACNDDYQAAAGPSKLGFFAQGGITYYIEIIDYSAPSGTTRPLEVPPGGGDLVFNVEEGNFSVTEVSIGGVLKGSYTLPSGQEMREYYDVSDGPVVVESQNGMDIVSAIRLQSRPAGKPLYSFVETMGVPEGLLSHKYYFPTYNNTWGPLNSQIRFGNLDAAATTIRVTIGGDVVWEESVPGQEERRLYFPVSGGPVIIESLDTNKKIVAAIRLQSRPGNILYSFSETMGIPDEQVSDTYYFPTYNNTWAPLNSQLRIGNLNAADTTVRVTMGSDIVWEDVVPGLEEKRLYFDVSDGPVKVESLDAKKIVAAIRLQSKPGNILYSFVETMGVPEGLLSHKYYFPTYNNTWGPLNSQIRFGNLDAAATTIRVTIGGVNVWEQSVPGREERRLYFDVSGGPVIIESLDPAKKIVAAIRLQSKPGSILYSFAETMGIPDEQVSDTYYFPTYNNTWAPLNSQLRFGVP